MFFGWKDAIAPSAHRTLSMVSGKTTKDKDVVDNTATMESEGEPEPAVCVVERPDAELTIIQRARKKLRLAAMAEAPTMVSKPVVARQPFIAYIRDGYVAALRAAVEAKKVHDIWKPSASSATGSGQIKQATGSSSPHECLGRTGGAG